MAGLQRALPASWYLDEAAFGRERERLLFGEWFCAGRAEQVERPGSLVAAEVVVGGQLPRPGPDQQHALAGHVHHLERPGPLELVGPPGAEPLPVQQSFPLPPEGRLVEVVGCGQGPLQTGDGASPPRFGPR